MTATATQRLWSVVGTDAFQLMGFTGHEGLSQPFQFSLDLVALNSRDVPFDGVLGQKVTVALTLSNNQPRYFSGICCRFSQGVRDPTFTAYRMELVPEFLSKLTRRAQSRIFQRLSVPEILKQYVLAGLDVAYEIQGTFQKRDYCVQYRETDFNFASRLMEEEGIYYFFKHTAGGHQMVLANTPGSHPDLPEQSQAVFQGMTGGVLDDRVHSWEKTQELRSGKYTLWDHCFELPHKHLEAQAALPDSVQAGKVSHKLKVAGSDQLEIYDYPGEYAQRFDGVDKQGGDKSGNLKDIFDDNLRTVGIRMQEEAVPGLVVQGTGNCRAFVSGHRFTLERHFNGDGQYLLVSVQHGGRMPEVGSNGSGQGLYHNSFTCIPAGVPFRPPRRSPRPFVQGAQTAVVVGPPGQEIYTDKYGRVKVQFHWDRHGKNNLDSSCWVRVAQVWAGKRWGASFWPRIGQEVVVDFLEGDPDQPIIVGSVYNSDQMPPYQGDGPDPKHPHDNKVSGVKTNTTPGGEGYNEIRFDDTKDQQQVFLHAERNMDTRVKNDCMERVIHDRHLIVGADKDGSKSGDQREMVYQDKHLNVKRHQVEHVEGDMQLLVGKGQAEAGGNLDVVVEKNETELIGGDHDGHVKGNRSEQVGGTVSLTVGGDQQEKVGAKHALEAGQEIHLKAGMKVIIEAGVQISLKGPGGFVDIGPGGVTIQGVLVRINSGGSAGSGSGSSPKAPRDALEAKPTVPTVADDAKTGQRSAPN